MALPVESKQNLSTIIAASSAGTLIEWYDFYIFGSLAFTIAPVFFPTGYKGADLLATLATFAIGFIVRPFGALFFGYLGDLIGRKYTFMITLLLMGGATFAIGLLPGYHARGGWPGIGWAAPIILIVLRLLQGLALGGEYGGAATYVAEHCPDGQRGYWTSWIQTTATLGLFVSLGVIIVCRLRLSPEDFEAWGWRIPFWVSLALVAFSYYIRRRMHESPLFQRMKASGKGAKNPLKESFLNPENRKMVILALFGATAGQGVVWYTGQFYAMNFTKGTIGVEATQTEYIVGIALVLATPFFIVFGALSDRVGRKGIMMAGCLLALVLWYPIYSFMSSTADVKDPTKFVVDKVVAVASTEKAPNPKTETLANDADKGTKAGTQVTLVENVTFTDGTTAVKTTTTFTLQGAAQADAPKSKFTKIKFPSLTHPPAMVLTLLIWVQVLFVTMVYGPIAAFLVELFPTRIRYTSMSLPYHIGNGVFGGVVPLVGQFMIGWTGNKFAGLWYPMAIALITLIIGTLLIRENRNVRMHDEH